MVNIQDETYVGYNTRVYYFKNTLYELEKAFFFVDGSQPPPPIKKIFNVEPKDSFGVSGVIFDFNGAIVTNVLGFPLTFPFIGSGASFTKYLSEDNLFMEHIMYNCRQPKHQDRIWIELGWLTADMFEIDSMTSMVIIRTTFIINRYTVAPMIKPPVSILRNGIRNVSNEIIKFLIERLEKEKY